MGNSWSNALTTSLTLPTGAQDPTPRIVENGITDTILVYGPGGALVASIAATAGTDALGNHYPAGISATGGFVSLSTILMYSGTPALATLTTSMSSTAGTDSFGNQYPAGVTTYDRSNQVFANMQGGESFWGALVTGQPDTNHAGQLLSTSIQLLMQSPITSVGSFLDALQLNILTGQPSQATGSSNTPQLGLLDAVFSSPADLRLSGSVVKTNLVGTPYVKQTPGGSAPLVLNANWTLGAAAIRNTNPLKIWLDAFDFVHLSGAVATLNNTPGNTVITVSAPYLPANNSDFGLPQGAILQMTSAGAFKAMAHCFLNVSTGLLQINLATFAAGDIFVFDHHWPMGVVP
jgi:hypothetical protein